DAAIGVQLVAATVPLFLAMSLLTECHRWSDRAIRAIDPTAYGGSMEMRLQAALGISLMFTRGHSEAARSALNRSLVIAADLGDVMAQAQLLGPLYLFHLRIGDFKAAFGYAKHTATLSDSIEDLASTGLGHSLLGMSFHLMGEVANARTEIEAALQHRPGSQ